MDWSTRSFGLPASSIFKRLVLIFLLGISLFFVVVPALPALGQERTADGVPTGRGLTPEECAKFPTICTPGKSEDIRTVVITIVNYLLTFLGLVAVVVIIYAGFRVVALAGNEAEVKKAQKTIIYTAFGIVIILIAYAIVNFVIRVVSGDIPPSSNTTISSSSSGGATSSGSSSGTGSSSSSSGGATSTSSGGSNSSSGSGGTTGQATTTINNIYNTVNNPPADNTQLENEINRLSSELTRSINQLPATLQSSVSQQLQAVLNALEKFKTNPTTQNNDDLKKALQELQKTLQDNDSTATNTGVAGTTSSSNTSDSLQKVLNQLLNDLSTLKNPNDFRTVIEKSKEQLQPIFNQLPPNSDTADAIKQLQDALNRLADQPTSAQNAQEVRSAVQQLQNKVAKLPQLRASITASKSSGPVPLTVSFDGTSSADPSGNTIPAANYNWWYLDSAGSRVNLGSGPIVSETFRSPNSYIIHLEVKSAASDKTVLPGEGTITIRAEAPLATFKLKVNQTDVTELDSLKVTLQDAQNGLNFDPTGTTSTIGLQIEKTEWDFGDGSQRQIVDGNVTPLTHKFNKTGRYKTTVSFTDNAKQKFSKFVNIEVADAIATATIAPTEGTTDTNFRLSANSSKIPSGVRLLTWKLTSQSGEVLRETKEDSFSYKFEEPGLYTALLEITDNDGKTVQDRKQIKVSSKPPAVKLTVKQKDSGHPNIYILDASNSYDPDQGETLQYTWLVDGQEVKLSSPSENNSRGQYTFTEKKDYRVKVRVADPSLNVVESDQTITVASILSADIQVEPAVTQVGKDVTISITAPGAVFYSYDFGEKKIQTDKNQASYQFTRAGVYRVKVTAADKDNNETTATAPVFVGEAESPVAILDYDLNGEVLQPESGVCGGNEGIVISRIDNLRFDASRSINKDGASRFLDYSWNFGDNTVSTKKTINHKFSDVSAGCYKVELTVTDRDSGKNAVSQSLFVQVKNRTPLVQDLIVDAPASLITPVQVNVRAVGAVDRDGRIVSYKWYYYEDGTDQNLDVRTTTTPATTFNVATRGFGGQKVQYHFVVELTDNDNATVSSEDVLGTALGTLTVTNRSNDPLQIEVTSNKTSVKAGEAVQFTALPRTTKGDVVNDVQVVWDFDGDGTFEDNFSGSYATKVYDKPGNYNVTAKIQYQGLSSRGTTSILVNPRSDTTTTSAFVFTAIDKTVLFSNNSRGTPPLSYEWDFDLSRDSDGDGNNQNDIDSKDENPQHTYDDYGTYQIRLITRGANAAKDDVVRQVLLQKGVLPKGVVIDPAKTLQAVLITVPEANQLDNKIHLTKDRNKVTFFAGYSVGKINEYRLDKNTFSDSDGDGIKDNDADNKGTLSFSNGSSVVYSFVPGPSAAQLTVVGDNNAMDKTSISIVFDDEIAPAQNGNQNTSVPGKGEVLESKTKEIVNSIVQSPLATEIKTKIQELISKGDKESLEQIQTLLEVDTTLGSDTKKQLIGKIQDIIDLKGTFIDIDSSIQRIKSIIAEAEPLTKIKINKALLGLKTNYGFDTRKVGEAISEIKTALSESIKLTPDLKEQVSNVLDNIADSLSTPTPDNANQNTNSSDNTNLNENNTGQNTNENGSTGDVLNENQNGNAEQPAQTEGGNNVFFSLIFGILGIILWIVGILLFFGIVLFVSFMVYKRVANRDDLDFEEYILDLRGMLTGFFKRFIPGKKEEEPPEIAALSKPVENVPEKAAAIEKDTSPIPEVIPEPVEGEIVDSTPAKSSGPMPDWLNINQDTDNTSDDTPLSTTSFPENPQDTSPATPSFLDEQFKSSPPSPFDDPPLSPLNDQSSPASTNNQNAPLPDFLSPDNSQSSAPAPSFLEDTPSASTPQAGTNPFDIDIFGDTSSKSDTAATPDFPLADNSGSAPLSTDKTQGTPQTAPANPFDIDIFGDAQSTPAKVPEQDTTGQINDPAADFFTPFTPNEDEKQNPASEKPVPSFLADEPQTPSAPLPDFLSSSDEGRTDQAPATPFDTTPEAATQNTTTEVPDIFGPIPQSPLESENKAAKDAPKPYQAPVADFSIPEIEAPPAEEQLPAPKQTSQLPEKAKTVEQGKSSDISKSSSEFKPRAGFLKKPFKPGSKPFYKKNKFYYNDRKKPPFRNQGPQSSNAPKPEKKPETGGGENK